MKIGAKQGRVNTLENKKSVQNCTDQLVEKVFFDKLSDFEKHTQTRKESPSAYRGTVGDS